MHRLCSFSGWILDEVPFIEHHVVPLALMRELINHVRDELVGGDYYLGAVSTGGTGQEGRGEDLHACMNAESSHHMHSYVMSCCVE